MLRKLFITSLLTVVVTAAAPAKASADWLFTPFIGWNFGGSATFNDSIGDFDDEFEKRFNYGASLAWMGGGIFGFEVDFGYAPNFFESTEGDADFDYGDSNVTTLMGNVVLGIPVGGQSGLGFRPYVSGGVGMIKSRIDGADDLLDFSSNDFGMNAGAGVTGFFTDKIGIRGDIRYFRSLQDNEADDEFDVALGSFRFWRGSVGVTFRF
jgi:opacity protein-like surface antigen